MNRSILVAVVALALAAPGCAHRLRLAERAAEDGNLESSFKLTRSAARAGNAEAQQRLGLMYQKGEGTDKDDIKAAGWLRKAVKDLDTAGLYLAKLYAKGRGLPEEDPDRAALLERLCDVGDSRGCYALGVWHLEGELVEQSDEESLRWFRRATETWAAGQSSIAALLQSDDLLRPVAELGLAEAQFRLAELYATGDRLPLSHSEAAKWYYLAAIQDHPESVVKMGWIYGAGTGVQKDYYEAFRWFTRGSELDVADAQYQLGLHYMRGVGVRLNDIEAHKWFNLAAAKGHGPARQKLGVVAKRLKPKQLAEAERLAVEWVPPTKE